ncbi:putative ABC transporter ATP-binding protein YadG [Zhongshania aliphaticivorans]|uniref:Putative ABC transporter ATP-binding protein YadG n=1 Tax=Zhongshania aliphaticivorans TaxID=1470434 RepID=A0A5S9PR90_9GAMM|nr:ABC transporter ATP-binding protein [Zhongshania aliphaticivorans]CAA0106462.1 putative ABC transporter ATP-binding protein YadG [Zhongshania aliphaticivorans]CAA0106603.1 putative ABC transporter ATP-binding protein YadG [Zhongshania aliphaticivorans]
MEQDHSPSPIVILEAINHRYSGATEAALKDINLTVPAGSCFGLLGPNGAGKTTLISLLTGIIAPQNNKQSLQGRIQISGFDYLNDAQRIKTISGLVPQDYAFYPALTGRENLQFFAGLYNIAASQLLDRIDYCVAVCGLEKVLDQRAETYSGGIKRRLNIALGLLNKPKILYLDEPTVGIDAQSRYFILQAIRQLKASGMTIVYTSHYMEEVEQICDEVAIIDHGEVLLQASMATLLMNERKLVLTPEQPLTPATLAILQAKIAVDWDGAHMTVELGLNQVISDVLLLIEQAGIVINKMHFGSSSLEQIYLQATHRKLRQ